jgi:hypothetical protein
MRLDTTDDSMIKVKKVKLSLSQAVEAHMVV